MSPRRRDRRRRPYSRTETAVGEPETVRRKRLAYRSLYRGVKITAYITEEFFSPVAAILAKLHRSGKRKVRHAAKTGADIAR